MMHRPNPLRIGDQIRIVAPAKRIDSEKVSFAKKTLEDEGFVVTVGEHCLGEHHYFSGTVEERLHDLQSAIDDPKVGAILCARGGYGCVQLVDLLDWTHFEKQPKWIIGFSDVTVLHQHLQKKSFTSIHGTMPLNFSDNSSEALSTLIAALKGDSYNITAPSSEFNIQGQTEGVLIGGNLAIIASLIGTNDQPDFEGNILFVEEIGEPLYSVDRMFYHLRKAGILNQIKGLVVGGMTSMKDSEIPFGTRLEEIIVSHTKDVSIPVGFNFPTGHIDDNQALVFGTNVQLEVKQNASVLRFS